MLSLVYPPKMTSLEWLQKFHADDDLGSAFKINSRAMGEIISLQLSEALTKSG